MKQHKWVDHAIEAKTKRKPSTSFNLFRCSEEAAPVAVGIPGIVLFAAAPVAVGELALSTVLERPAVEAVADSVTVKTYVDPSESVPVIIGPIDPIEEIAVVACGDATAPDGGIRTTVADPSLAVMVRATPVWVSVKVRTDVRPSASVTVLVNSTNDVVIGTSVPIVSVSSEDSVTSVTAAAVATVAVVAPLALDPGSEEIPFSGVKPAGSVATPADSTDLARDSVT